jgi:hypothetical protein
MRYLIVAIAISICAVSAQPIQNSMVYRQQVIGDLEQMDILDVYGSQASPSQTMTLAGVHGSDEGPSIRLADGRIFIFFGDSVTTYYDSGASKTMSVHERTNCNFGPGQSDTLCLGTHVMALLPSTTQNDCHSFENLKATIQGADTQYSSCPAMTVITDPAHTGEIPKAAMQSITGAQAGDFYGAGVPPVGGFSIGTTLYAQTLAQTRLNMPRLSLKGRTVLLKSDIDTSSITSTNAPTWTRGATISEAPTIPVATVDATNGSAVVTRTSGSVASTTWADDEIYEGVIIEGNWHVSGVRYMVVDVAGNTITLNQAVTCSSCSGLQFVVMPRQDINIGKFIMGSCEYMAADDMPSAISDGLPAPLQGQDVLFCFGSTWAYRKSNLYLMAMLASTSAIDAATYSNGLSNAYYLTATTPTWTLQDEDSAVPLLQNWDHVGTSSGLPCIGEHSVRWYGSINRWVATYGAAECGGIWARTSDGPQPWKWSREVRILVNHNQSTGAQSWHAILVHSPANDNANFTLFPPVYDPDSAPPYDQFTSGSPFGLPGNAYGPYQLPPESAFDNGDGTIRIFTLLSSFNPYVVSLASFDVNANGQTTMLSGRSTLSGKAEMR